MKLRKRPNALVKSYRRLRWLQNELRDETNHYHFVYSRFPSWRRSVLSELRREPGLQHCVHD